MEHIVSGMAHLSIRSGAGLFETWLDAVYQQAARHREDISPDERSVTRQLQGPFTKGGLLALLWQPRGNHPWQQGFATVIANCPGLDALNEGLLRNLSGGLSGAVSLLDIWAFLPKYITDTMKQEELDYLAALVISAIRAKQPDCVLCMGQVRGESRPNLAWYQV